MNAAPNLTAAEMRLLRDLCDAPILRSEADYRRPYWALQAKGLVRHNATVGKVERAYWAPTAAGREIGEG